MNTICIESAQSHVQWNVDQSINGIFRFRAILEVLSKRNKRQSDFRCGGALTLCMKRQLVGESGDGDSLLDARSALSISALIDWAVKIVSLSDCTKMASTPTYQSNKYIGLLSYSPPF